MKYFKLYIFLLILFIFIVSYYNTYKNTYTEQFNSNFNKQTFILLGDSILNNNAYVDNENTVNQLLIERTNGKIICLAMDDSTINDVYNQLNSNSINDTLNNKYTTIFLSIGGNNILYNYVENINKDDTIIKTIFTEYKKLVKQIQHKFSNSNIVLLDIYYPNNSIYKQYHSIINKWNKMIYNYAKNPKNKISSVFKISNILTQPEDFTLGIEPSSCGSIKLVNSLLNSY